jgi:DHA1 family chloramphenicol resistance protein-like MFS transporter
MALLVGWGLLGLTAGNPVAAVVLAFVQGVLSFGVGSTLISRVLYEAADAPTLAGGFATAAFNVGGALGPWLGGLAIGAGLGYRSPVWVSAVLVGLALVVGGAARRTGALAVRVSGGAHADGVRSDGSGPSLGQPRE